MSTIKDKTFSSGKAAVSNARDLAEKGEISQRDLRNVERSVRDAPKSASKEPGWIANRGKDNR